VMLLKNALFCSNIFVNGLDIGFELLQKSNTRAN
jgi:hypothetical protein